jgi:hypothetical protein
MTDIKIKFNKEEVKKIAEATVRTSEFIQGEIKKMGCTEESEIMGVYFIIMKSIVKAMNNTLESSDVKMRIPGAYLTLGEAIDRTVDIMNKEYDIFVASYVLANLFIMDKEEIANMILKKQESQ